MRGGGARERGSEREREGDSGRKEERKREGGRKSERDIPVDCRDQDNSDMG